MENDIKLLLAMLGVALIIGLFLIVDSQFDFTGSQAKDKLDNARCVELTGKNDAYLDYYYREEKCVWINNNIYVEIY